jgi:hypothetical protein
MHSINIPVEVAVIKNVLMEFTTPTKRDVVAVDDEIAFSKAFAQGVLEKSARLGETFLKMIHLTSGTPVRATELVDMRVTVHDVQPNLLLAGREVYFEAKWSKNSGK